MSSPKFKTRRQLQQILFLIWLLTFSISIGLAVVRFYDVVSDYWEFLDSHALKRCRQDLTFDLKLKNFCTAWANDNDIDVFQSGWEGNLLALYIENIAKIYLPILAVMLTTFLTSSANLKDQLIRRDQYSIACGTFTVVHILTLIVVAAYLLASTASSANQIPNLLATAFSVVMGIVVGFSFPDIGGDGTIPTEKTVSEASSAPRVENTE